VKGTSLTTNLCLTQEPEADQLLSEDPFALLVGMLLDQQVRLETVFADENHLGVENLLGVLTRR